MKRRDSIASLFSGHGSKKLVAEDEGLLTDSEDDSRVSPPNEADIRPPCLLDKDTDPSSSWSILADPEPEENNDIELRDRTDSLVNKRLGSREKLNRSLSDIFSRVGKPKIHTSRAKCVLKQKESKIFDNVFQVSLK